ncbi:hypothetical protein RRG08_002642 [Elysia crispata]|uniref:Uncharacterized protein n=1 Tax=Elysia crispata TaxID=231223 RepID=A0AAE1CSS6_9GAST|nr:hypothetical protein RRG08_002642 [Elysia crispata]
MFDFCSYAFLFSTKWTKFHEWIDGAPGMSREPRVFCSISDGIMMFITVLELRGGIDGSWRSLWANFCVHQTPLMHPIEDWFFQ